MCQKYNPFLKTFIMRPKSHATCHMSHVLCQISHVTCHLPPVNNAKNHKNIPSTANPQVIGSKGRSRSQNLTRHETILLLHANLAICPLARSLPETQKWAFHNHTDRHTHTQSHTDRHGNAMSDPAQSQSDILENSKSISFLFI